MVKITHSEKCIISVIGRSVKLLRDFFELPFKSSHINIFTGNSNELNEEETFELNEIKCKLVAIKYGDENVFIPLIHTLDHRSSFQN